ncbi:phosphoribosylamine--glycine ligase [Salisaeta longa]|uniref:phosphoribosylamine--glycine ligase n=1 Tax=Salisaeta longa TaxID=503170 RepID=UPI0003B34EDC|nr:phosphoribosylamine--glycine ligase [Salisaeta longa]
MRILILGSGGREHALARAFAASPSVEALFVAPGNPGTAALGTTLDVAATNGPAVLDLVATHAIDMTVIGPEQPLVDGVADRLRNAGHAVVGPSQAAARLEGSKAFAKAFMQRCNIPTAAFKTFSAADADAARAYLDAQPVPIVVKASGLAGGKGAFVCATRQEAHDALDAIVEDRAFGTAGDQIVIEEFMTGEEASVFALTDGDRYVLLTPSQDHKAIGEGGVGPNTGGMGAYAPAPVVSGGRLTTICRTIIEPTLAGMAAEGHPYQGILYCGLMMTDAGPKVVEFNCRLGDPEAQVVLPLIANDVGDLFMQVAQGELRGTAVQARDGAAACVVLASGGYPTDYETGFPITGIEDAETVEGVHVIHAGTARADDGTLVTAGGRVCNVVGVADTLEHALERAYRGVEAIEFEGKTVRRDIGQKGLMHQTAE